MNDNLAGSATPRQNDALRTAASSIFGDGFWGRERINPEPAEPVRQVGGQRR